MRARRRTAVLILGLAACGGRPAGAEPAPPAPGDALAHAHLYQVPVEQDRQSPPTLEVSGSATVSVSPDRVKVSFAVETHDAEAAGAATSNADAMTRVISALRGASLPGLRIETYGYSLSPDYTPATLNERTLRISGYTALNNIRVTITDVEAAGKVMDTAIGAGANRVSGLAFVASETAGARKEALTRAVAEARAQAEAIAAALGRELGPPVEVRGGAQEPQPRPQAGLMMAREMATPIEAGDLTVSASVTIRYALGPETGGR